MTKPNSLTLWRPQCLAFESCVVPDLHDWVCVCVCAGCVCARILLSTYSEKYRFRCCCAACVGCPGATSDGGSNLDTTAASGQASSVSSADGPSSSLAALTL
jgi:hypothetical protein